MARTDSYQLGFQEGSARSGPIYSFSVRDRATERTCWGSARGLPVENLQGKFMGYLVKSESEKRRPSLLGDDEA